MAAIHPPIRACFRIIIPVSGGNSELPDEIGRDGPAAVGLCPQFVSGNLGGMGAAPAAERASFSLPRQPRRAGDGVDRVGRPDARGWGVFQKARDRRQKADNHRQSDIDKPIRCPTGRETVPSHEGFSSGGGEAAGPTPTGGSKRDSGFEGMGESETTVSGAGGSPIRFIASRAPVQFPTSRSPVRLPSPLRSNSSRFPRGLACSSPAG